MPTSAPTGLSAWPQDIAVNPSTAVTLRWDTLNRPSGSVCSIVDNNRNTIKAADQQWIHQSSLSVSPIQTTQYTLNCRDAAGTIVAFKNVIVSMIGSVPATVANLRASDIKPHSLVLKWDRVPNAVRYAIYRDDTLVDIMNQDRVGGYFNSLSTFNGDSVTNLLKDANGDIITSQYSTPEWRESPILVPDTNYTYYVVPLDTILTSPSPVVY